MEQDRRLWNTLETTVSYKARARLTPTLTHVVAYELATSGAEGGAMSIRELHILKDKVQVEFTHPCQKIIDLHSPQCAAEHALSP
jgi:hypothetical protein